MTAPPLSAALDFAGRRALVTGASRGFGAVLARRLATHGAHVFINYVRDDDSARRTLSEIEVRGGSATLVKANLIHRADLDAMFDHIATTGRLDILIHNAALGAFKRTLDVRANQWDLSMSVNARALLVCAQKAAPLMSDRSGKIVSISSIGSVRVLPSYGAIGASKAALESLTRYLAVELAPRGINVNAVSAGLMPGTSIGHHPVMGPLAAQTDVSHLHAVDPDDVASVALFLCSPLAKGIVGQTIVVDGGCSLSF